MTTSVIQIPSNGNSVLDQAEIDFVDGVSKTGELLQAYADVLCEVFDRKDTEGNTIEKWFNLVGKEKKGINERKASFVQRMINRGYTKGFDKNGNLKASGTVDVYWQRVKEASGYVTKGNRVSGGTDVDSKTLTELKTMINRILKSEEEGKDSTASMFKGQLMEVFEGMGGDVDTLG